MAERTLANRGDVTPPHGHVLASARIRSLKANRTPSHPSWTAARPGRRLPPRAVLTARTHQRTDIATVNRASRSSELLGVAVRADGRRVPVRIPTRSPLLDRLHHGLDELARAIRDRLHSPEARS